MQDVQPHFCPAGLVWLGWTLTLNVEVLRITVSEDRGRTPSPGPQKIEANSRLKGMRDEVKKQVWKWTTREHNGPHPCALNRGL
jgi:hypothetical protein